jgi:hypothetical protein
MAVLLAKRVQPRMTAIPSVVSSGDVSRTDRTNPATPTIDSAQATQYVADSKMNVQEEQQGLLHSRHVMW